MRAPSRVNKRWNVPILWLPQHHFADGDSSAIRAWLIMTAPSSGPRANRQPARRRSTLRSSDPIWHAGQQGGASPCSAECPGAGPRPRRIRRRRRRRRGLAPLSTAASWPQSSPTRVRRVTGPMCQPGGSASWTASQAFSRLILPSRLEASAAGGRAPWFGHCAALRPRHRQGDRGGADLSRSNQGHGHPGETPSSTRSSGRAAAHSISVVPVPVKMELPTPAYIVRRQVTLPAWVLTSSIS